MRYFKAPSALFNALRLQVIAQLGQPNAKALQPWNVDITNLALNEHEYEPPEYAALIDYALANGGEEITREEYVSKMLLPFDDKMMATNLCGGLTPVDFPEFGQLVEALGGLDARIDLDPQFIVGPNIQL